MRTAVIPEVYHARPHMTVTFFWVLGRFYRFWAGAHYARHIGEPAAVLPGLSARVAAHSCARGSVVALKSTVYALSAIEPPLNAESARPIQAAHARRSCCRKIRLRRQQICSPRRHIRLPRRHIRSPRRYIRSPHRHIRLPHRHIRLPHRHIRSPRQHIRSPRQHIRSPRHHICSPRQHIRAARRPPRTARSPPKITLSRARRAHAPATPSNWLLYSL